MNLKAMGQIGKRLDEIETANPQDLELVDVALKAKTTPETVRLVEQIASRYAELTTEERAVVDGDLASRIEKTLEDAPKA